MNQPQNIPGKLCNFMPGDVLVIACSMVYLVEQKVKFEPINSQ